VSARDALAAIRERAEAATEGPWVWDTHRVPTLSGRVVSPDYTYDTEVLEANHSGECGCRSACELELDVKPHDAEFIAHARTDVPALVGALEAVLDLVAEWGSGLTSPLYELGPDVATEISEAIETALEGR
jgi:hypothetical protein